MKARIIDGKIGEILAPIQGFELEDCFHPQLIAMCVDVADDAQVGDDYVPLVLVAPIVETPIVEATTEETPSEPTV